MESQNSIQKLKNNLFEKTLVDDIDKLLTDGENKLNSNANRFLTSLKRNGKLFSLNFNKDCGYIRKYYDLAFLEFQKDKKVAQLSYGLAYTKENVYLYIKKEAEEALKYIQNYQNINPIDINDYLKSNVSKNSKQNELMLKGGLNLYGYSFEFNVNYFFKTLSDLIELPDLAIDLSSRYKEAHFKELDLAFYNLEPVLNKNVSLLRTTAYFKILQNKVSNINDKPFEIYENSLILGEIKSRFPKAIKITNNNKTSLEEIINKLFDKLEFFYKLYRKIGLFNASEIENVELIFFYDNVQLKNLNSNTIIDFINQNKKNWKLLEKIPIHLFIVYTLPAITNISIYDLKNKIQDLEKKDIQNENQIQELQKKDTQNEEKIKELENKMKNLEKENRKILLELGIKAAFNVENNLVDAKNENKILKGKKEGIFDFLNIPNKENNDNNNEFDINNIFDFTKKNNETINNNFFDFNLVNNIDNNISSNFYDFTKANNNLNYELQDNNKNNPAQITNNNIGDLLIFDENNENQKI